MDPNIRSSFIPKKPVSVQAGNPKRRRKRFDALSFVGSVLFVVALAGSAYVFWVERVTNINIDALGAELQEIQEGIDFSKVDEYQAFSKKINAVSGLLRQHTLTTKLLKAINERTLHDVGFSRLTYTSSGNNGEFASLQLSGSAASLNALVVQSDELRRENIISDFTISSIKLDEIEGNGEVGFKVSASISEDLLLYTNDDIEVTDGVVEETDEIIDQNVDTEGEDVLEDSTDQNE